MKKVVYLYNNLLHDLYLQDLTQIESYKQYAYEDIYIENTKDIKKYYDQTHSEVIIFNLDLDFNKQLDIIESISRTHNPSKIIVLIDNKEFQEMLFNSHIPNRIFYRNVTKDILVNTICALLNEKNLALEEIYRIKIFNDIIEKLDLKKYNSATRHFVKCLYILYNNISLLDGHLNNAYYVVSKYDNVSYNAVKKSIIRVINLIKTCQNKDYLYSIFGTTDINYYTASEILQRIIGYLKNK